MTVMIINAPDAGETERQLKAAIAQTKVIFGHFLPLFFYPLPSLTQEDGEYGIVIDGHTLQHALDPVRSMLLLQIAKRCAAVICCRVSPLQKVRHFLTFLFSNGYNF